MNKKERIQKFMKKVDKTRKPKHWIKFINKNTVSHNIIIKYGKRAFCTHCQKFFEKDFNILPHREVKCERCGKKYDLRNHGIQKFIIKSDVAFYVKVDNKIVLRIFEIKSTFNAREKKFKHSWHEFARFIPGEGLFINNTVRFFYYHTYIYHDEKITNWRQTWRNYLVYECPIYPYNKKSLYKNTPLEYAPLDEFKKEYSYYNRYSILNIANHPSFEFLWKMGLHKLSLSAKYFTKKGNFYNRFGVPKSLLSFMQKENIDYKDYLILKLLQKPNKELLGKYRYYDYNYLNLMNKQGLLEDFDIVEKYRYYSSEIRTICQNTTFKKFLRYSEGVNNFNIYVDYLKMANKIGYSVKAKDRLFPQNLIETHDKLSEQIEIIDDCNTQFAVYLRFLELSKYIYSDDEFICFPAFSVDSIKDEGKQQGNCVATTYLEPYKDGKTEIYFVRKLNNLTKSFITLEYKFNRVFQKELPHHSVKFTQEHLDFINKWASFRQFMEQKEKYNKQKETKQTKLFEYDLDKMVA